MSIVVPGTGRVTLALLAVAPAVIGYPWRTVPERWALGVAVGVMALLFGWWRGLHLTTIVRRRFGLLFGRRRLECGVPPAVTLTGTDARTTAVLRVIDGGHRGVPFDLIAGYLDRYGLRCDAVRVTSRDTPAGRTTWIGLTMSVAANLPALQARSTKIPLRRTADLTARRLADELRERGWAVTGTDLAVPDLLGSQAREHWRAVADGSSGFVAAYSIAVDTLPETLTALWSEGFDELWTAIEVSGGGLAAACAIRTEALPGSKAPLDGLVVRAGTQWAALRALAPESTTPLDAEVCPVTGPALAHWSADGVAVPS
ncbi:type VII secretion protein EccE [Mycolicibacterium sp. CH28]|uniref:type VII secretion protein EccE n=1 Tax=Mycolicibacterium sp. CH28 TaxID=2512237 RepID=UPI001081EB27|nr:type VII secretion protein EccE [Mycolicibacterium sp. CH28]TGD84439.1 type VII secretion protein EccE [Mycolicibacterium sp. CH28]